MNNSDIDVKNLELENWKLKGILLDTQRALMEYQYIEVRTNIDRLSKEKQEP